jgi:predicted outer membrane repeat protein
LVVTGAATATLLGGAERAHASAYYVYTSTISAMSVDSGDGYCSLAEAVISANDGGPRSGCEDVDPDSFGQTIVLAEAAGLPFSMSPYEIESLNLTFEGLVVIQTTGGRATINAAGGTGDAFTVSPDTTARFWSLDLTHTGSEPGRLINNQGFAGIYDSTLSGGDATGLSPGGGGAVLNTGTAEIYLGTELLDNTAERGGAIYNLDGHITLNGVAIAGNTAMAGGAIYNLSITHDPDFSSLGNGVVEGTDTTIVDNSAVAGGAIFSLGGRAYFYSSDISDNTASGSDSGETCLADQSCDGVGGAVAMLNSGDLVAHLVSHEGTLFAGNVASGRGGAFYSGGQLQLDDSVVDGNTALTGAAIYVVDDNPSWYCEVVARTTDAFITNNVATAPWGYSILDGADGVLGGASCIFDQRGENQLVGAGNTSAFCEPGRPRPGDYACPQQEEPPPSSPCASFCSNPEVIQINGSYQSGNLGTGAICRETTDLMNGGNCGNFSGGRTLTVNGVPQTCNYQNWASLPPPVNGGYCVQVTPGSQAWAYFVLWQ